jgi:hypothetical protein
MQKFFWVPVAALLAVLLAGCARVEPLAAEVELRVTVCTKGGAECFALGAPEVMIKIESPGGQVLATGKTDGAGRAMFTLPDGAGELKVIAESVLLAGGRVEGTMGYPNRFTSLTMNAALSTHMSGP